MTAQSENDRFKRVGELLARHGQQQVLAFWDELDSAWRAALLDDVDGIDFDLIERLIASHVRRKPRATIPENIEPPAIMPNRPASESAADYREARRVGAELIGAGKVAAFTVAGGQGTRLGFDGPKGGLPISVVRDKTLFQLFAEFIGGAEARYGGPVPWYIMTSPQNDSDTRAFFAEHGYFGLRQRDVVFFRQGQMPAFSPEGKLLLADKHRLSLSPDGHGGCLMAMAGSGALADMRQRGIEHISYFQVDNPLVSPVDPLFLGLHHVQESEMSSKTVPKAKDKERVGNFCIAEGKTCAIEYSDLPCKLATAKEPDGRRRFDAASIAIHALRVEFVERLTDGELRLPWHRADKKVAHIDPATGRQVVPGRRNAVKLETFVFDAIPLAGSAVGHPLIYETRRDEEFSPVKNPTGVDSIESARRDLNRRAARWLTHAGFTVPYRSDGEPDGLFEIDPAYALDAEHLRERAGARARTLSPGERFYLTE